MSDARDDLAEGLRAIHTTRLPPGQFLIGDFSRLFPKAAPLTIRRKRGWKAEIRQIVRDGVAEAHPWLILPPELPDEEERERFTFLAEQRIALVLNDPRAIVAGTIW